MKRMPGTELGQRLVPYLKRAGLDPTGGPDAGAVAVLLRDRAETLVAMADAAWYFYAAPVIAPEAIATQVTAANRPALDALLARFATLDWSREALAAAIKGTAATHGLKPPALMMPLRLLVAGTMQTPAIDAVLALLGRETVCARVAAGLIAGAD
jgi:glutamyl-tRNA synthetase